MVDPLSATLGALSLGVNAASVYHQRDTAVPDGGIDTVGSVKEFWGAHRRDSLNPGSYVTVDGTLSVYAPMIFGDPQLVKQRHFEFRDALSMEAPAGIDALVSISSGQPVIRLQPREGVYYAGLYQGIGRNSIPVFIDEALFDSWRKDRTNDDTYVWDVALTGQLDDLPTEWDDFFSIFGLDQEAPEYAIYVKDDDVSGIEYRAETGFFEADIWAAYKRDGGHGWITRCPDFAERTEIRRSIDSIIENLASPEAEGIELISQYDLVDRPFGTSPDIAQTSTQIQEMSNRRVRENYIDEVSDLIDSYT
ncbi:hypothetical protein C464_00164 [Halorubrum coriense DSM 10284]|uniref:Uncharacterized protein n=1 Tax=Halorubrum coriense DSM 10284 TaxID=1227466 RepID=M0EZC4_9EURY|nr:hypothetical protein [Halorubrum coriense]ELZ51764.1 hypothetical protein C464_00164 [Halorubrum coriense DSM 10284]